MKKETKVAAAASKEGEGQIEVTLELNAKGIPIWKNKAGKIVEGLRRPHFFSEVKPEHRDEATKEFCSYMIELKKERVQFFTERAEAMQKHVEFYTEKLSQVGRELTNAEKLEAKMKRLEVALANAKKAKAALEAKE